MKKEEGMFFSKSLLMPSLKERGDYRVFGKSRGKREGIFEKKKRKAVRYSAQEKNQSHTASEKEEKILKERAFLERKRREFLRKIEISSDKKEKNDLIKEIYCQESNNKFFNILKEEKMGESLPVLRESLLFTKKEQNDIDHLFFKILYRKKKIPIFLRSGPFSICALGSKCSDKWLFYICDSCEFHKDSPSLILPEDQGFLYRRGFLIRMNKRKEFYLKYVG